MGNDSGLRRSGAARVWIRLTAMVLVLCCSVPAAWAAPRIEELLRFDGSRFGDSGTRETRPPDTMGAIGPHFFAELLNSGFSMYRTSTNPLGGLSAPRITLEQFWDAAFVNTAIGNISSGGLSNPHDADSPFDPRILYDSNTGRWYATSVDFGRSAESRVYVGVTTGDDPSINNWRAFVIDADAADQQWADFPTLGLDASGLYIGTTMVPLDGTSASRESDLIGIPLQSLTAPTPSTTGFLKAENVGGSRAMQPAVDVYGVTASNPGARYLAFTTGSDDIRSIHIPADFLTGGSSSLGAPVDIGVTRSGAVDVPYHPSQGLAAIDVDNDGLKQESNVVLTPFGYWGVQSVLNPTTGNNAIQWFNVDELTGSLVGSGLIEEPTMHFIYPSISVSDTGRVVIGFNWMWDEGEVPFDRILAPSAMAVGGIIDPMTGVVDFGIPEPLQVSGSEYENLDSRSRNRWGDYSATTAAPQSTSLVYTIQEYAPAQDGNDDWATSISQVIALADHEVLINFQDTPPGFLGSIEAQAYDGGFFLEEIMIEGGLAAVPDGLMALGDMGIVVDHPASFSAVLRNGNDLIRLDDLNLLIDQKFTLNTLQDGLKVFDVELLSFDLLGLPADLFVGLSQQDLRRSSGRVSLIDTPGGTVVDSHLDLYTVLGLDGDLLESMNASRLVLRAAAVPEPTVLALALPGLALLGARSRRRAIRRPGAGRIDAGRHDGPAARDGQPRAG